MSSLHSDDSGNVVEPVAEFNLEQELEELQQKKPWPSGIHSKLLFKKDDFRCLLIAMEPSAELQRVLDFTHQPARHREAFPVLQDDNVFAFEHGLEFLHVVEIHDGAAADA